MITGTITSRLLRAYRQSAPPTRFLSGMFTSPPENFFDSEEVQIDIVRNEEDVSIAIRDLSVGYRNNSEDLYTNKAFKPPIHKEAGPLNAFDLLNRMPGQDPFTNPDFAANATVRSFAIFRKCDQKIRRAMELQASQVLQAGVVSLIDDTGAEVYGIDYKPKATHFPTVGTAWSNAATATPLDDISALGTVIRTDGLSQPSRLVFGQTAWDEFIRTDQVKLALDNRRIDLGAVAPASRGEGAVFMGFIWAGSYRYEMWTYTGRYKHPQTGVSTPFITPGKVIMTSDGARLDAVFGSVPRLVAADPRVAQFLPGRMSDGGTGIDLSTNAWITPDGQQLFVGAGTRPLMIPTAIDTYGCLTT